MKRDLKFEAFYDYPPEKVWTALTDSEAIAEWLMPNDFQPKVGHRFTFRTKPGPGFDGIVHCEVTELDPPRRLSFSWKGGGIETNVAFTLAQGQGGTKVVLEHTGFSGMRGLMVSAILGKGWKDKILPVGLPAVLARLGPTGLAPKPAGDLQKTCH
jgi:uncharacterized protein YndB with AHSA1/START domain